MGHRPYLFPLSVQIEFVTGTKKGTTTSAAAPTTSTASTAAAGRRRLAAPAAPHVGPGFPALFGGAGAWGIWA